MTVTRDGGYLRARAESPTSAVEHPRSEGFVVLSAALSAAETDELRRDIDRVFDEYPPDIRRPGQAPQMWNEFRYEMLNRSPVAQRMVGHRASLDVIEPLLGEDCHVIANSAWRNPAGADITRGSGRWHVDGGPHVPLPDGVDWDERIPPSGLRHRHPVLLQCPTPRAHRGGKPAQ